MDAQRTPSVKVVVCEDDPATLDLLTDALTFEGYKVHRCSDADQTLKTVQQVRPDLLVTDGMFHSGDGLDLIRQLRGDSALGTLPVIVLTAATDKLPEHRQQLGEWGVVSMGKPFDLDEFLRVVASLVSPTAATP